MIFYVDHSLFLKLRHSSAESDVVDEQNHHGSQKSTTALLQKLVSFPHTFCWEKTRQIVHTYAQIKITFTPQMWGVNSLCEGSRGQMKLSEQLSAAGTCNMYLSQEWRLYEEHLLTFDRSFI